jgi:shikimate kinase
MKCGFIPFLFLAAAVSSVAVQAEDHQDQPELEQHEQQKPAEEVVEQLDQVQEALRQVQEGVRPEQDENAKIARDLYQAAAQMLNSTTPNRYSSCHPELFGRPSPRTSLKSECENFGL